MPTKPALPTLAVIGCGLIGGSFALALKHAQAVQAVRVYDLDQASSARALALGVADSAHRSAAEAVQSADIVLLAMPVAATEAVLGSIAAHISARALIMDIGSIKGLVQEAAERALAARPQLLAHFVPAHPIAGKEKAGVEHAQANLFCGKPSIICPHVQLDPAYHSWAAQLWQVCGSSAQSMDTAQHDYVFAAVSHLPHVVAYALIDTLRAQKGADTLLAMSSGGLLDTTRIAASPAHIWRDILHHNRVALRPLLRSYIQQLHDWDAALDDSAALSNRIAATSRVRLVMEQRQENPDVAAARPVAPPGP